MKRYAFIAIGLSVLAAGCAKDDASESAQTPAVKYAFSSLDDLTRVSLDQNTLKYTWDGDEQVVVSFAEPGSGDYTSIDTPFAAVNSGTKTDFEATTAPQMDDQNKDYIVMYPYCKPAGGVFTYYIGEQTDNGAWSQKPGFEGAYNLMRAECNDAVSLNLGKPDLAFKHLLTSLRVYIKIVDGVKYKNLQVTRFDIEFPANVVGKTSVTLDGTVKATADKVTVDMSSSPITPMTTYSDDTDNYALVLTAPFTLDPAAPIIVTAYGSAEDSQGVKYDNLAQTAQISVSTAKELQAGYFYGLPVKLASDNFEMSNGVDLSAIAKIGVDYGGSSNSFYKGGECAGTHARVHENADNPDEPYIVLDNTNNRWTILGKTRIYAQSAFYMPNAIVLEGYTSGEITVSFDANVIFNGPDKEDCPIIICSNHIGFNTLSTTQDWRDRGCNELGTIYASPAYSTPEETSSGYPCDSSFWRSYTITVDPSGIADFNTQNSDNSDPYIGFKIPGDYSGFGSTTIGTGRLVYIKNISYTYNKSLE